MSHLLSDTTLIRRSRLRQLKSRENAFYDLEFIKQMPPEKRSACIDLLDSSVSQVRQDIFALAQLEFKHNGFFVEFGATNGTELSNSLVMERDFGWTGILAEPARGWHDALKAARKATIYNRCVCKESGNNVEFTDTASAINSSLSSFVKTSRKMRGQSDQVQTVSLNDLLAEHKAPAVVDYISIDTEGSEYDILSAVDFDRWSFRVMTVEHNHEPQREQVFDLLSSKGYTRVCQDVSRFDDWYVKA
ncbi:FkbM family methyltransferase [Pseudooceanicola sp.]|uniref:FkbM family methyltransferase n=1 Tax=Pseudooceanicola sp. TaxID=1914328 RepID=UPI003512C3A3